MLKKIHEAIKLFLLKKKIGYKDVWYEDIYYAYRKSCVCCLAYKIYKETDVVTRGFCDRYKFNTNIAKICKHFVPKYYNKTISNTQRDEFEKAKKYALSYIDDLLNIINSIGVK